MDTDRGARWTGFDAIEDFEERLDRVAGDRMKRRCAFAGGNLVALYDAATQAIEDAKEDAPVRFPQWVADGLQGPATLPTSEAKRLVRGLKRAITTGPAKTRRGRGRPRETWNFKMWRRDSIDWIRFRQVHYRVIARRADSPPHPSETEQRLEQQRHQARRRGTPFVVDMWTPYFWKESANTGRPIGRGAGAPRGPEEWSVFQAVSKIYEGTIYGGSWHQIKKSWERVKAALKAGEAWRYYPAKFLPYDKRQTLTADSDVTR